MSIEPADLKLFDKDGKKITELPGEIFQKPAPWEDPGHPHNSSLHHTGEQCIADNCYEPAGTWWSPYWCFFCNRERIRKININFKEIFEI